MQEPDTSYQTHFSSNVDEENALPVQEEFVLTLREMENASEKRTLRMGIWFGCVYLAFAFFYHDLFHLTPTAWRIPLVFFTLFLSLPLPFLIAVFFDWLMSVRCPHCRVHLRQPTLVIAMGRCPNCRQSVFQPQELSHLHLPPRHSLFFAVLCTFLLYGGMFLIPLRWSIDHAAMSSRCGWYCNCYRVPQG